MFDRLESKMDRGWLKSQPPPFSQVREETGGAMKKTDLEGIKSVARAFLYVDIAETRVGVVATHPFTNSWVVWLQGHELIDLHDEEKAAEWRKQIGQMIDEADLVGLFLLLNPAYILNFLKFTARYMSNEDLGRVLGGFWNRIEQISLDKSVTGRNIISWYKRADRKTLMDDEDRAFFNSLPDEVTVYRGVTSHNRRKTKAFSWSVDKQVAEWFAKRFATGTGEVWTLTVPKERILSYIGGTEKEVIVNLYGYDKPIEVTKIASSR